jgi:hypothetical protein
MRICRTILALLLALSVATLPAAGMTVHGNAPVGKAMGMAMHVMAMSDMAAADASADMHDCCPQPKAPCGMPIDQCPAYSCAQSVVFSGASAPHVIHPFLPAGKVPALADRSFHPQAASPPLRPPRI